MKVAPVKVAPEMSAAARLAFVRLASVKSAEPRSAGLPLALLRSQPCRSTPGPRAVQSTGATVVVVVVVVVVGTGAGVHAANNAIQAANRTMRSEPCFRIIKSPLL